MTRPAAKHRNAPRRSEPAPRPRRSEAGARSGSATPNDALWAGLVCCALAILTAVVYAQLRQHGFIHFDDDEYIYANPHVATGLSRANIAWAFTAYYSNNWHPITWISHMIDCQLFGLDPGAHHAMGAALHGLNAILVFVLLWRLTGALWRSAIVAAVFAVHPMHVESVAWASERKDVLSTCFGLLTLLTYAAYAKRPRVAAYLLVLLLFALGIMSKPMLVTLPFVMLLLDYWPLHRFGGATRERRPGSATSPGGLLLEKLPMLAIVVASSILTLTAQSRGGVVISINEIPLAMRGTNALVSFVRYAVKLVLPLTQAFYYPYAKQPQVLLAVGATIVLIGVSAWCWRCRRERPWAIVGWLWYVGTLVPVIGLVQVATQSIADRYTYIPSIGLSILIVWGLGELAQRAPRLRPALIGLAAVALIAMAAKAHAQAGYWRDGITLFTRDTQVVHDNVLGERLLGVALSDAGRYAEAIPRFENVLRIHPQDALSWFDIAVNRDRMSDSTAAEAAYRTALALDPNRIEARYNLATMLSRLGHVNEAIAQFDSTVRQRPDYAEAFNNLGNALSKAGRDSEAVLRYRDAIRLNPGYAQAYNNLGTIDHRYGRDQEALEDYAQALRINPAFAEAELNTGIIYLARNDTTAAREHFGAAIRIRPDLAKGIPPELQGPRVASAPSLP